MNDFEKDMAAFSFNQHQDALTYLSQLERKGWTIIDAENWIHQHRKARAKQTYKCPLCGARMRLLSVNDQLGTQTGDPTDHSVFLCNNKNCMNSIYNKQTIEELKKEG